MPGVTGKLWTIRPYPVDEEAGGTPALPFLVVGSVLLIGRGTLEFFQIGEVLGAACGLLGVDQVLL